MFTGRQSPCKINSQLSDLREIVVAHSSRCARSQSPRCRCLCEGRYHGILQDLPIAQAGANSINWWDMLAQKDGLRAALAHRVSKALDSAYAELDDSDRAALRASTESDWPCWALKRSMKFLEVASDLNGQVDRMDLPQIQRAPIGDQLVGAVVQQALKAVVSGAANTMPVEGLLVLAQLGVVDICPEHDRERKLAEVALRDRAVRAAVLAALQDVANGC